jgi:hypothetical protein
MLLALGAALPAHALTVRALSVDELVGGAARIVRARCLSVRPAGAGGLPVNEISLAVDETLKGAPSARLVVRQLGGRSGASIPTCTAGDEVVLFLYPASRAGLTSPVGSWQGYLRVVRPPGGVPRVVGDARIVEALVGRGPAAAPSRRSAGAAPPNGIASGDLDELLAALRARIGAAP